MATVEQHVPETQNGVADAGADKGIPVENPATGETIATVPDLDAAAVAEMAARGRAAQPEWEAYGFEGRARVLLRAQKWVMDNADADRRDDLLGDGQDLRGRRARRDRLRRQRLRLLGEARRRSTSPTSASSPARCSSRARS